MNGNENCGQEIVIVCRKCKKRINMSQDPENMKNFLKAFFSEEDWKLVSQQKLLPGTTVSVPVCLSCFHPNMHVQGGIIFSRMQ